MRRPLPFMRRSLPFLAATAVLLAACNGGDEPADDVQLESSEGSTDETPEGDADEVAGADDPADDRADDGEDAGDDPTEPSDGADTDGTDEADSTDADLVDLTQAVPGTWPVGNAGTVAFEVDGDALVLGEITTADGWSSEVDEEDADEIEVDFRGNGVRWEIEIELDGDGALEIEIRQDIDDAAPGSYDIGDAGTFAVDLEDDRLVLTDLTVADGWTVEEQEEDGDEIEIDLVDGDRRFDVEVELDDGRIEVEIDYTVVG